MALNPFFLQGSTNEQFLVQDLINEQLKIYGVEVYYLPRKIFSKDNVIEEIQSSKFDDSFLIEAYINNYDGYNPGVDIMSKFGLKLKNEVSLTISRERFEEFITPFLEGMVSGIREGVNTEYDMSDLVERPKEGDLIYFPLGERLFEIKRVEFEKPFYQLGRNYIYELECELYEYENEQIDTSIEEVDNVIEDEGFITTITLVRSSTQATATAIVGNEGMIGQIVLTDDGSGYTSRPTVTISDPVFGTTATAVAITTSIGGVQSIDYIAITSPGSGYDSSNPPTVTFTGGGGVGAAATVVIVDNGISALSITNPGSGYYSIPTVTIGGPSIGETATAVAVISEGKLNTLRFTNTGYGYTEAPSVTIESVDPTGIGTFRYNETVIGQTSGTEAIVRDFRTYASTTPGIPASTKLRVSINNGSFYPGEVVVGTISSARYVVESYDSNSYEDPYDSNEEIELGAIDIIDFTETNPFGEY